MISLAQIKEFGEYLSEGSTRTVYRMGGKVYKVDQFNVPRNNTSEYLNFIKYRASKLVCPILNIFDGGKVLEMPECITLKSYLTNKFPDRRGQVSSSVMNDDIKIIFKKFDLSEIEFDYSSIHDTFITNGNLDYMEVMYGENWGILNNKLVLLDYSR